MNGKITTRQITTENMEDWIAVLLAGLENYPTGFILTGEVSDGDDLQCDVERRPKGLSVSKIHRVNTDPDVIERVTCDVVKIIPDRGYGFVAIEGYDRDAFFHFSSLSTNDLPLLNNESRFEAEIRRSEDGSTAQVRKIIRFL